MNIEDINNYFQFDICNYYQLTPSQLLHDVKHSTKSKLLSIKCEYHMDQITNNDQLIIMNFALMLNNNDLLTYGMNNTTFF